MPRSARLHLPGVPLHVTQRGVNHADIFLDNRDRYHFLALVGRVFPTFAVQLHAYVLMSNHVHLLLSAEEQQAMSRALRQVGQCYVQAFNHRHQRSGALWQGRFKSCLVDSDAYVLCVYRYIELNPVRAALVALPQHYRWSSIQGNLGLAHDALLTPHPTFLTQSPDEDARRARYQQFIDDGISSSELREIRLQMAKERVLGSPRFHERVANALGRHVTARDVGRPALAAHPEMGTEVIKSP